MGTKTGDRWTPSGTKVTASNCVRRRLDGERARSARVRYSARKRAHAFSRHSPAVLSLIPVSQAEMEALFGTSKTWPRSAEEQRPPSTSSPRRTSARPAVRHLQVKLIPDIKLGQGESGESARIMAKDLVRTRAYFDVQDAARFSHCRFGGSFFSDDLCDDGWFKVDDARKMNIRARSTNHGEVREAERDDGMKDEMMGDAMDDASAACTKIVNRRWLFT